MVDLGDHPSKLAEQDQGIGAKLKRNERDGLVVMDYPMPGPGETREETRPNVCDVSPL